MGRIRQSLMAAAMAGVLACAGGAAEAACKLHTIELPVRMVGARPITTLELDGVEVPLLVDSGAFFSVLTEAAASQLKLPLRSLPDGMHIEGYTGLLHARMTKVKKVRFVGTELQDVEFIVGLNELGAGIMGVLGRNFLSMADAEYDLAHGVVRLVFPKGECGEVNFAYWAGDAPVNVVPLEKEWSNDTRIRVEAHINSKRIHALLDTGAPKSSLNLRVAHRAGIQDTELTPDERVGGGGAGHARSWSGPLAAFELGGEKIGNSVIDIDEADGTDVEMLLGMDYFLSHRIYVSKLQRKLYATWNGNPVFARAKAVAADAASRYAAAEEAVAADDAEALARRGEAWAARGDWTKALKDLDRACELAPREAAYVVSRARVRLAMKESQAAREELDRALQLAPALGEARALRAELRFASDDRAGALEDLAALDAGLAPSSHLRAAMARLYARMERVPEALRQWELWVPSHRHDAQLGADLNERCWLRTRLKLDLPLALDDCKEAVDADDDVAAFQDSLGWTYLRLGETRRAIKAFDRALQLEPKKAWSYYGRGVAQRAAGNASASQGDLQTARSLQPEIDAQVKQAGFEAEAQQVASQ